MGSGTCRNAGVVTNNPGVFGKIISSDITLSGKTGTAQQSTTHPDMDYLWDLHPAILAIKRLWH